MVQVHEIQSGVAFDQKDFANCLNKSSDSTTEGVQVQDMIDE